MRERGVWVVVPAYNEATVIRPVVDRLVAAGHCVVVVDDGSTDGTAEALLGSGADVCRHAFNLGQGAALQTGIEHALAGGARFIVTFDSDGQHRAAEIPRLLAPLLNESSDVALGSRLLEQGRPVNMPRGRRWVLKAAVLASRLTTGLSVTDAHNGLRAFSRDAASKIRIRQNRMAHGSEVLQQVRALGLRYTEVPVTVLYTDYSLRKGQKLRNAVNILWESLTAALRK